MSGPHRRNQQGVVSRRWATEGNVGCLHRPDAERGWRQEPAAETQRPRLVRQGLDVPPGVPRAWPLPGSALGVDVARVEALGISGLGEEAPGAGRIVRMGLDAQREVQDAGDDRPRQPREAHALGDVDGLGIHGQGRGQSDPAIVPVGLGIPLLGKLEPPGRACASSDATYERELVGAGEKRQALELLAAIAARTPISIGCFCEYESRCRLRRLAANRSICQINK